MDPSDGEWVERTLPDGDVRRVWRPDEQPPSPDGLFGSWYVVSDDGGDRWEWVPVPRRTDAGVVRTEEPAAPMAPPVLSRRSVIGWVAAAALTAVIVGVAAVQGGGSAEFRPASAEDLAQDIGIVFDRFQIADEGYLGRSGGLAVTFINQGRTARTFWTTIAATGPGGLIATETLAVQGLEPGKATSQTAFAEDPHLEAMAAATFTVTRTDGTPPPLN